MKPKLLIFWLSFLLLGLSTLLQAKTLGNFLAPLMILYATGWSFSWLTKDKNTSWIKPVITSGVMLVLIGIIYSIANSFFLFQEIILIFLAGIMILIAFLSFNSYVLKSLNYIQILTFLLFITFPVFTDYSHKKHLIIILLYISTWIVILRLKFYLGIQQEKLKPHYITTSLLILLIILSLAAAGTVLIKLPPSEERSPKFSFIERLDKDVEDHYYAVQDNLLKQAEGLKFKDISDKSKTLFFLSSLLKEFPATKEVMKSTLGLTTHLKIEGPGIEKGKIPEFLFALKEYLKEKSRRGMIRNRDEIKKSLAENNLTIKEKLSTLAKVNKISHAGKALEVNKLYSNIEKTIDKSSINKSANKELKKSVQEFKNWKLISIYTTDIKTVTENTKEKEVAKELKEQLYLLSEKTNNFPASSQLNEARDILEKVKQHKDARGKNEKDLINGYKNILDTYSSLTKDIDLKQYSQDKRAAKNKILESISVPEKQIKLIPGQKKRLKVIGNFADGSKEEITEEGKWHVTDEKIAEIEKGVVSASSPGETTISFEYLYKKSKPVTIVVEEPKIESIVIFPSGTKVKMGKSLDIEARAYYSDFMHEDITSLVKWNLSDPKSIKITKDKLHGLKWGKNIISAEYQNIESESIQITVTPSLSFILKLLGLLFLWLLIIVLIILRIIQKARERRMKGLLQNDPRGFVIALYGNIKKILKFFNMPYNNLPIFQYARVVMKNAPSNANPFFNFTRIFTQANYSSNEITLADGINALENYNGFLKILLRKEEPFSVFIKHSLIFLNCIPLFIASKNIKKQY